MNEKIYLLIKKTTSKLPQDLLDLLQVALNRESGVARDTISQILKNSDLASARHLPLCQDTGVLHFYVKRPLHYTEAYIKKESATAMKRAFKEGLLRVGSYPEFHFEESAGKKLEIQLLMKGGGSENMSFQYSLPDTELTALRDDDGIIKVVLDALVKAQGFGCPPGIIGICIGGDRAMGHALSKKVLLRNLSDINQDARLATLEKKIVKMANQLGIGPMGLGGKTTLLAAKCIAYQTLPASFFVTISYMCHAYRKGRIVI